MKKGIVRCLQLVCVLAVASGQMALGGETIRIGIALPIAGASGDDSQLRAGAELAVREINNSGGAAGRQVELVMVAPASELTAFGVEDRSVADSGRVQASQIKAYKPIAVVGHNLPAGAAAAATVYRDNGILFFATSHTDPSMNADLEALTFRMEVTTNFTYEALAQYARDQGWCQLLIFSERTPLGKQHTLFFKLYAQAMGLTVLGQASFNREEEAFLPMLVSMMSRPDIDVRNADAMAVIGMPRATAHFLSDASELKLDQPVLIPWFGASRDTFKVAGAATSKGIFQVVFDIENRSPELMAFNKNFLAAYDMAPARDALIAYDSIRLLMHTIEVTGSTEPQALANSLRALRYAGPYMGLSGPISFDSKGRRLDVTINTGHVPMSRLADREEVKTFLGRRTNPAAAIDILETHRDGNRSLEEIRAMPMPVCRQHQT